MFRVLGPGVRLCDGWNRREILRIGGLGALGAGLSLPELSRAAELAPGPAALSPAFGSARSCIVLFLMGVLRNIRRGTRSPTPRPKCAVSLGRSMSTSPGVSAQRAAAAHRLIADKICVLRAMAHGRQRPLIERLLHADRAASPADELRERQSGRSQRCAEPGSDAWANLYDPRRAASDRHAAPPNLQH